jgi:selenium metabolism protein YedF
VKKEIDARGLACPQPVIMARKAIEGNDDCVVIVDNDGARENVCRMAGIMGRDVDIRHSGNDIHIHITGGAAGTTIVQAEPSAGPTVVVFPSDKMGQGDDELGSVLIRAFIHAAGEASPRPDVMIFFNSGVNLAAEGSEVLDDLQSMERQGVKMLVCGTCLDFFCLKDSLRAGMVSNMYDIAETMLSAGRIVRL